MTTKPEGRKRVDLLKVVVKTGKSYFDGDKFTLGAALAFYTVFSIAPMLILVMAIAGLAFGHDAVEGQITRQMSGLLGKEGASQIETMVKGAAHQDESTWAAAMSVVLLLMGATSMFAQLRKSLDAIWEVRARRRVGLLKLFVDRLFSFAMVVCLGFLLLVSLVIHAGMVGLAQYIERDIAHEVMLGLRVLELGASFGLTTLLFAIIYKFMSDAVVKWKDAWAGAAFTAVLFNVGKYAIGTYLGHTRIADTYGVAGSVVVLLLWVYYSSQIVFIGAEFTQAFAEARGTHIVPGPLTESVVVSTAVPADSVRK